jgi:hypothetical protein
MELLMDSLVVNDGASILKICENSYAHKTPLILHQPGLKFKALIVAVNLNTQELVIRPVDPSTDFSVLDPNTDLYINNAPNSILFRTNFRGKVRPYFAIIKIPDSLLIRNHRETQRTNFNHIKLPVHFKNFTIFDYQLRNQQIEADIFDLSESGIALKTEVETIQRFKENDKIIFTLVNGYSFTRKVEGRLIYVKEYENFMHESYYKMGIAFSDDSCGVTFKRFIDNQIFTQS